MIECPECGQVGHIRTPEDEAHCGCCHRKYPNGRGVVPAANADGSLRWADCPCECHN